jgi:uncharacterized protein YutE (UPF0331/DUF86 family)
MPQFDQETMVKLVSELRKNDPDKIGSAKYHFIVAIESCIDMCNHVISRNGFRAPEDYGDTFRVMNEEGALKQDFADELVNMAKFRNRLVHIYLEVENKQVYEILQDRLDDFKKFIDSLSKFLGWQHLNK